MPRDLRTGEPRGFAFVRYMSQRDADDAIDRLDGEFFAGRELRIQAGFCSLLWVSLLGIYVAPRVNESTAECYLNGSHNHL